MQKITKYHFLVLLILLLCKNFPGNSQTKTNRSNIKVKCWIELQGDVYYDNNNFYIRQYKDYLIPQSNTKIGLRVENIQKGLVIEPYFRNSTIYDMLENIWNNVDWHNNMVNGFGIRTRYSLKTINFINDKVCPDVFNIDLFTEKLWIDYLKTDKSEISFRPENDFKTGIQYWLDLGSKQKNEKSGLYYCFLNNCWVESAGSLVYSKSDFYVKTNENFYLLSLNNKIGPRFRASEKLFLEPYYCNILLYDIGHEIWNRVDWHNNVKNGFGFRINYLPKLNEEKKKLSIVLILFTEYMWIRYFNSTIYVPSYRPKENWYCGINLWLALNGKY